MQVWIKSHKLLALVAFIALVVSLTVGFGASAGAQETAPQPTISSDKEDYPPGGTVVLTGSDWQPGESVNIFVNDDDGKTWSREVIVTADENGNIRDEFQLPDWFVATYYVTATGDSGSVAKTTFTDAKINLRADLGQNQEWVLRYEVYSQLNCTGSTVSSETKKGQSNSVIANPDISGSRSVKLFASHKTVHTSNQVAHEGFDKWIQEGSTVTWPHQTQDNVTGFSTYNAQNPNGKGHWICVNGQNGAERTFVAVYKQSAPPAPPSLTASNDGPIVEGGEATITGTATDPDTPAGQLQYQFDCDNDGTYEKTPPAGVNTAKCSFGDDGDYTVNVRVLDGDGGSGTASTVVRVNNVAPLVKLDGPSTVNEGDTKEYTFEITDPGADDQSPEADCGDGGLVPDSFQYDAATGTGSFRCQFPDVTPDENLVTPVTVTTNDGDASGSDSVDVSVLNVAPTAMDDEMTTTELKKVKANLLDNDEDPGQNLDRASLTLLSVEISPNGAVGAANVSSASLMTAGGSVEIDELLDGKVAYTPNRGFVDIDAFRYEVCDEDGDCSRANVEVEVGPVDCSADGVIQGTERADALRGTPGDDVICALGGNDRIYAGGGDDLLIGGAGWDRMWAETGNDVMRGGSQTDAMDAGLGDDYLSGDGGKDIMMGRGGIDFLEMDDGSPGDAGNGGAGTDTCSRDTGDKAVSCERR